MYIFHILVTYTAHMVLVPAVDSQNNSEKSTKLKTEQAISRTQDKNVQWKLIPKDSFISAKVATQSSRTATAVAA